MEAQIYEILKNFAEDVRKLLKDNLIEQYVFGSFSKNKLTEFSDIDILFIVNKINPDIRKAISSLASEYSIDNSIVISPILKEKAIWEKNKKYETLFYSEVKQHGIAI